MVVNFFVAPSILYLNLNFGPGYCKKQVAKQCEASFFCKAALPNCNSMMRKPPRTSRARWKTSGIAFLND
jgi:hypothetical protein